ncbi:MAG: ABC transporter ATP-binding protein [Erysipelotrichaceae bacterium]|nr:ABC transporter ATP-binding protein [Erysipelotrichaceae bacterium]
MNRPILELIDVNKAFGGVVVAEHVNLKLYPGEIHGLIGPNGAGKTTLLNLISGIYEMDSGRIELNGEDISNMPAYLRARKGIGRTFQMPRFLDKADIEENIRIADDLANPVSFLKSYFGKNDRAYVPRLNELTRIAGFSFNLEDDISSLTFGQRKMLEIIRAILANHKVLLVDEPAAGLNGAEIENEISLLKHAAKNMNMGILLIEHSMDMIMNICSNITVINFGSVIGNGTPDEIAANQDVIEAYLGRSKDA